MENQYKVALIKAIAQLGELVRKREYLDAEIMTARKYIRAAINMLPVEERPPFEAQFDTLTRNLGGLTDAIRDALRTAAVLGGPSKGFVTATQVRDLVLDAGFNFAGYKSNPLASVSTVLSRLKPKEVEMRMINGVTAYRWKGLYTLEDVRLAEVLT